ncbi:MAG: hypothetical protein ACOYCD_07515 [Kiritimatiellia bacterium]|jgi:hypothetical protein
MPDDIIASVAGACEIHADDILFECGNCGKSLVIDRQGAGLIIRCPDCNVDLQVPIPDDVDLAEIDKSITADLTGITQTSAPDVLNLDDLPPDLQEKVRNLVLEAQELQARRAHLEKQRAITASGMQMIRSLLTDIRSALEQVEATLASMEEDKAGETQTVG